MSGSARRECSIGKRNVFSGRWCGGWFWVVGAICLLSGCRRSEPLQWVYRSELDELPKAHQEAVRAALEQCFGTAVSPRWLLPRSDDQGQAFLNESGKPVWDQVYVAPERLRRGQQVYQQYCAGCHGVTGDGAGPAAAYLNPRPRDYRLGVFKFTSTPYGSKPRRSDLERIVRYGAKGTSMPAFRWLADADRDALIDYVLLLTRRGELERALIEEVKQYSEEDQLEPAVVADLALSIEQQWHNAAEQRVVPVTPRPPYSAESRLRGYQAFVARDCIKCHGRDGRGHTQENVGKDAWGNTVHAADLTSGFLHGGRRPVDIYRRIYAGINGTPMPAFATALAEEPEVIWDMVHFVLGLATGEPIPELPQSQTSATDAADASGTTSEQLPESHPQSAPQSDKR